MDNFCRKLIEYFLLQTYFFRSGIKTINLCFQRRKLFVILFVEPQALKTFDDKKNKFIAGKRNLF